MIHGSWISRIATCKKHIPIWLHVEYAITFFKSFWNTPMLEEKKAVNIQKIK